MLVLTRKRGQQIAVPCCNVTIEVLRIAGRRVRLGVSAPKGTAVHRAEVLKRLTPSPDPAPELSESRNVPLIRVLLADPDPCLARSYREFLIRRRFEVHVVSDGLQCVARLREDVPNVLVLDPDLPWGGGSGVLALMREDPTVPLVPTLIHAQDRGPETFWDDVFPVVQQSVRPLAPSQLEAELRSMMERFGPWPNVGTSDGPATELTDEGIGRRLSGGGGFEN